MEIIPFVLGVILIAIGLPFCLSCQIRAFLDKDLRFKTDQEIYQHVRRDRNIGLFFMIIGVFLIVLSFASSVL